MLPLAHLQRRVAGGQPEALSTYAGQVRRTAGRALGNSHTGLTLSNFLYLVLIVFFLPSRRWSFAAL